MIDASSSTWTEADRLKALRATGILDTDREPAFDDIVELAASLCETPVAVVNLIDAERQWFKAEVGLGVRETPLETSFCRHALLEADRLVVPDARKDARFACNPLVTAEGGFRFYAGVLLKSEDGAPLGTLCVLDVVPRPEGLTPVQLRALEVMASQVMTLLDLRRGLARERAGNARFDALADSMPQMVWSTRADGFHDYFNARWHEFTGTRPGSTDGAGWSDLFHPEDRERAWEVWRESLATGEPYEIEYRLRRHDGLYRWTLGRATAVRDDEGEIVRWFGTCTDIDDLKQIERGKELVSQELSHRIKNIFAVVSALVALSARQHPEAKAFSQSLRTRINALARAHEFVRPHTEISAPSVGTMTLHAFLEAMFRPYTGVQGAPRVLLSGDDAVFDDQAATSVALLFHEMATNAAKYGALSDPDGWVTLETRKADDRFILVWREHGGPPVTGAPTRAGFGTTLSTLSVEGQLGGRLERLWLAEGLVVKADLPATALSRRRAALKTA
ncbi:sensor histidine kinase [Brevundimonas sp. P7753]|uniref:sensor histidine kinase n=1 Tax=Brevundimonas sp. P7753 TaxID=2726982 RepID=UPI001C4C3C83|nr:PAS domain-containing protein [Brevundimonas sp. P7753]